MVQGRAGLMISIATTTNGKRATGQAGEPPHHHQTGLMLAGAAPDPQKLLAGSTHQAQQMIRRRQHLLADPDCAAALACNVTWGDPTTSPRSTRRAGQLPRRAGYGTGAAQALTASGRSGACLAPACAPEAHAQEFSPWRCSGPQSVAWSRRSLSIGKVRPGHTQSGLHAHRGELALPWLAPSPRNLPHIVVRRPYSRSEKPLVLSLNAGHLTHGDHRLRLSSSCFQEHRWAGRSTGGPFLQFDHDHMVPSGWRHQHWTTTSTTLVATT